MSGRLHDRVMGLLVQQDCDNNDRTLHDGLIVGRHAHQIHAVVDHTDGQSTDETGRHRTNAASHAASAQDAGDDGVKLISLSRRRLTAVGASRQHDTGQCRADAHVQIGEEDHQLDVDACRRCCLAVSPGGINGPAKRCGVHYQPGKEHHQNGNDDQP